MDHLNHHHHHYRWRARHRSRLRQPDLRTLALAVLLVILVNSSIVVVTHFNVPLINNNDSQHNSTPTTSSSSKNVNSPNIPSSLVANDHTKAKIPLFNVSKNNSNYYAHTRLDMPILSTFHTNTNPNYRRKTSSNKMKENRKPTASPFSDFDDSPDLSSSSSSAEIPTSSHMIDRDSSFVSVSASQHPLQQPPPQQQSQQRPISTQLENVTDIIKAILEGYDIRLRPNFGGKLPNQ